MALVVKDRVRETTATTGTSAFVLAGAVTGYDAFSANMATGDTTFYGAVDASRGDWEVGVGTYVSSTNSLSRTAVLASSNADAPVSFAAGSKYVFLTQPSARAVYHDGTYVVADGVSGLATQGPLRVDGSATLGDSASGDSHTVNGAVTIAVDSSGNAVRITQTGSGNALVVQDSSNPDATPFVVTTDGNVGIGAVPIAMKLWVYGSQFTNALIEAAQGASFVQLKNTGGSAYIASTANDFAIYTSGAATQRVTVSNTSGGVGIGSTALTARGLVVGNALTGNTTAISVFAINSIQSDVTAAALGFYTTLGTQAATFTLANLVHFSALQGTLGAGSAVTTQVGYLVNSNLTGATSNYGFRGQIAAGTGRYNLYMDGTAANYLAGSLGVGTSAPTQKMEVLYTDTTTNRTSPVNVFAITSDSTITGGAVYTGFGPALVFRSKSYVGTIYDGSRVRMAIYDDSINTTRGAGLVFDITNTKGGAPVEAARIDYLGNIGHGVAPSSWGSVFRAIDIQSGGAAVLSSGTSDARLYANAYYDGANWTYKATGFATGYQQNSGVHSWYQAVSSAGGASITFTTAMVLNTSGQLGVGRSTSLYAKLTTEVSTGTAIPTLGTGSGHFAVSNGSFGVMHGVTSTGVGWIQAQRTDGTATAYGLLLNPVDGNVGVGTVSIPGAKLHARVVANAESEIFRAENINTALTDNAYLRVLASAAGNLVAFDSTGSSGGAFSFRAGNVEKMHMTSTGLFGIGVTPVTKMDVSGAQACNIVDMSSGTAIDCALGNYYIKTVNGSVTFTVSNVPSSRAYAFTIEITFTSGAITWFSGVQWPGGTAPTLATSKTHLITFVTDDGGTIWRGVANVDYS